jgi:phage baseplate assembly protein V
LISSLNKLLDPLRRRVRLMISRAVLSAISDGSGIQLVQVKLLEGEVRDGVERFQNYGFTGVPIGGAEGIMACVSGNRDHGVIIAMDDRRYRVKGLQSGEVAMYSYQDKQPHKHRIIFKKDGSIEVLAKNITVKATETARIEGDVVKIHAISKFQFDCSGHGQQWMPDRIHTWQIGAVAGSANPITPPEIP